MVEDPRIPLRVRLLRLVGVLDLALLLGAAIARGSLGIPAGIGLVGAGMLLVGRPVRLAGAVAGGLPILLAFAEGLSGRAPEAAAWTVLAMPGLFAFFSVRALSQAPPPGEFG